MAILPINQMVGFHPVLWRHFVSSTRGHCDKSSTRTVKSKGNAMVESKSGQYSKVETDGRLMIVTINRPEVYNACHPMANQELVDAFDSFQTNPDLWVAIITGAGDKARSEEHTSELQSRQYL